MPHPSWSWWLLVLVLPFTVLAAPGDLLWADEFDVAGQPDSEYWAYDVGGGGWGNWCVRLVPARCGIGGSETN